MTAVRSSNVAAHGYDASSKTLAVQFANGGLYHYAGVPADVAAQLGAAESKGSFFASHVRGKFTSTKVGAPAPKKP